MNIDEMLINDIQRAFLNYDIAQLVLRKAYKQMYLPYNWHT